MMWFILGLVVGACIGAVTIGLVSVNSKEELE